MFGCLTSDASPVPWRSWVLRNIFRPSCQNLLISYRAPCVCVCFLQLWAACVFCAVWRQSQVPGTRKVSPNSFGKRFIRFDRCLRQCNSSFASSYCVFHGAPPTSPHVLGSLAVDLKWKHNCRSHWISAGGREIGGHIDAKEQVNTGFIFLKTLLSVMRLDLSACTQTLNRN